MTKKITNGVVSITVTFNPDLVVLEKQISSLLTQVSKVIVVDNGSKNIQSIVELSHFLKFDILDLKGNLGIAKAQNEGISAAIKYSGASHVILFDHDSLIEESFIEELLEVESELLGTGHKVGAVGPAFMDTRTKKMYQPIRIKDTTLFYGLFTEKIELDHTSQIAVEPLFIIASGCLIRLEVLEVVGSMKEELFIDTVDTEWCYRAKSFGFGIFMGLKPVMMHTVGDDRKSIFGKEFSVHSSIRRYYNLRNNLLLLEDNKLSLGFKMRSIFMLLARFILGFYYNGNKLEYIKLNLKAIKDFSQGTLGKISLD